MSDDNELHCYEYVVHFPGGQNELRLPALGQATMMFVLPKLLMGTEGAMFFEFVPPCGTPDGLRNIDKSIRTAFPEKFGTPEPRDDEPVWFDAMAGWEATIQVASALGSPEAGRVIPPAVLALMCNEIKELTILLLSANEHQVPFYMSLEVSAHPPEAVLNWWQADLAETAEMICQFLDKQ